MTVGELVAGDLATEGANEAVAVANYRCAVVARVQADTHVYDAAKALTVVAGGIRSAARLTGVSESTIRTQAAKAW